MTVWAGGDIITSTYLNSVEKVLALGTFDATANPRLTVAPNSNFDLIGGLVATNMRLNGSVTVGANKYYSWMDARDLTSTITSGTGTPYAAILSYNHEASTTAGCGAYGVIGTVLGTSGAGKISGLYSRITSIGAAFTGIGVAVTAACTSNTGTVWDANSSLVSLSVDTNDLAVGFPIGIDFTTNNAGAVLTTAIAVLSTLDLQGSVLAWNMRAGSTGSFLNQYSSASVRLFNVDYLGNLNFKVVGPAVGQLITGDMTNATHASRLMFQTATVNSTTSLGVRPSGSGTVGQLNLYNGSDPDNAGRLSVQANTSGHLLNTAKSGSGSVLGLGLQINGTTMINIVSTGDVVLGKATTATGDTAGHLYIQSVAGAPTGAPAGATDHVAVRYNTSNDKLYVYNAGWKSSTAYT